MHSRAKIYLQIPVEVVQFLQNSSGRSAATFCEVFKCVYRVFDDDVLVREPLDICLLFGCECLPCSFHLSPSSILGSFHLDFIVPPAPSCGSLPSLSSRSLPLPERAWLRCEIILLLGGFSCYMSLSSVGTGAQGGVPFPKGTPHSALNHPAHNKFLGTRPERGAPTARRVFYWAWLGNT